MTGDVYRKPTSGEPFRPSAAQFGMFIDAARAVQQLRRHPSDVPSWTDAGGWVWIRNESGATVKRGGVLMPTGIVIDPADNEDGFLQQPILTADKPDDDPPATAVLLEPIADNTIGRAFLPGVALVRITGESDKKFATPDEDATALITSDAGFPLLFDQEHDDDDERWGVILLALAETKSIICRPKGDVDTGEAMVCDVQEGPILLETDTGETIIAVNGGSLITEDTRCEAIHYSMRRGGERHPLTGPEVSSLLSIDSTAISSTTAVQYADYELFSLEC